MANMLGKVKERWAARGPFIGGLRIRRRKQIRANRARENDALQRQRLFGEGRP